MKKNINHIQKVFHRTFLLIIVFSVFQPLNRLNAQENTDSASKGESKITPTLKLSSVKNTDGSRKLTALLSQRDQETKEIYNLKGVTIDFYVGQESETKLGSFETDENGKAICLIKPDFNYPKNDSGLIHFNAAFPGNNLIEEASADLDLKDVVISMKLEEVDSVKTVSVKVEALNGKNEKVPLNEVEIPVCVNRMFSHLKVGSITLANGEGSFEFPAGIPGDTIGNLDIIVKFDESEDYGTVLSSQSMPWGIPTKHYNAYSPRALWTSVAPVWMIITLSVMLLGVWGHYIFVIIQLIKLKLHLKKEVKKA
ncbi:MAG: hypothetical protein U0W24_16030 [Bacteroidales bacterium]